MTIASWMALKAQCYGLDMLMQKGITESAPLDIHRRQVVSANAAMINMQMAQR